jgi:hypothetical protein
MDIETPFTHETVRQAEQNGEATYLHRPERLKTIKEQLGFYPQSNEEMARVISLMGREGQFNPVLVHLDEIYKHQRKVGADAPRALRSVVRSFGEYAGNALNERSYMETFSTYMDELRPNPLTRFDALFPAEAWKDNGTMRAVFTSLGRYVETTNFVEDAGDDTLGKKELIDYTTGDERVQHITDTLGALRISSVQRTARAVSTHQENRFTFWMDQLELSKRHLFARELASEALKELTDAYR